ncbi:L10-interacting MYB domain-containing-like protein [Cinnamomum micranthum f. kanehirae]|uniref:L10-interacting MYB domain-containing-like protein n=1 Tax=Cinnamomum micranthum f. kanehirae TaxID=337451 RepID=A0A443PCY2_9MAGN|nr:L10-interacting MYB domain-containing-like protein [Cinnamomum micranthum f. kanehirae]
MIDEEVQCINVGQSSGAKRGKRDKKNVTWTEIADEFLTNVLIEQITLGQKDGIGFALEGWREIERKMKEKFGDAYDKAKIRNRLKTVKIHYNHIKILMCLSGFGWDDIKKRVIAEDQVWDDYLKAHPDYKYYRGRSFPDFENFAIIYGDSSADDRDVILTNQRPSHPMAAPKSNHDKDMATESSSSEKKG